MGKFIFNGDWQFELQPLKYFRTKYTQNQNLGQLSPSGLGIQLIIQDKYGDTSPDPEHLQLKAVNFILEDENQLRLIDSFISYLNEVIYPFYKEKVFSIEDYPEAYPIIETPKDFLQNFRFKLIVIGLDPDEKRMKFTFYLGSRALDDEHGLCIEYADLNCVKHGSGDGSMINTPEEAQKENEWRKKYHHMLDNEKPLLQRPHPKYNKLKPWQTDANRRFIDNAYRELDEQRFLDLITKENIDISEKRYLYVQAKADNKNRIVNYFDNLI